jgi:hypothetical protein
MKKRLALAAFLVAAASSPALAFEPRADLVAGDGGAGVVDDVVSRARFAKPVALAYGANGELFVIDQSANRVRAIAGGRVRTVAGDGSPGYRDGAAATARFSSPSALLVRPDGSVLVADTGNRCIRRIAGGAVATFAGTAGAAGTADGAAGTARFRGPVGISTDGASGYYVADGDGGLRHVDAAGTVTTTVVPGGMERDVRAVDAVKRRAVTSVYLAGRNDLWVFHPETNSAGRLLQDDNSGEPVGTATNIVAIGPHEFLYADPARHAVRYYVYRDDTNGPFNRHYAFPLTGPTAEDALATPSTVLPGGGGPIVAPVGVALAPDGSVTFADAATRRIRSLTMADRRIFASGDIADLQMSDQYYRIAYVSNSYAFRNMTFDDTMGGWMERVLNRDRASIGLTKPVRVQVFKLQTGLTATSSYVTSLLGDGLVDEVVWGFNDGFFAREEEQYPAKGTNEQTLAAYAAIIADMNHKLAASGIGLFVVYHTLSGGYGQGGYGETQWAKDPWLAGLGAMTGAYVPAETRIDGMFRAAGVSYADIDPDIWAAEDARRPAPLFGTQDGHPTPYGNRVLGELIARELERTRPWSRAK